MATTVRQKLPAWAAATIVLTVSILVMLGFVSLVTWLVTQQKGTFHLPMLVVAGVIALLGAIGFLVVVFAFFHLQNSTQALGLPDGSVRAIVALMLLIIFSILAVYYFEELANGVATQRADFAKQVVALMGTLLTAVTTFYFSAKSSSDALAAPGVGGAAITPELHAIEPSYGAPDGTYRVTIFGTNLLTATVVKLVRPNDEVRGTWVLSGPSVIRVDFNIPPATADGTWDVVVETAAKQKAVLKDGFRTAT